MQDLFDTNANLEQRIRDYDFHQTKAIKLPLEPDKWVCASAMQKAIRRGQTAEAIRAAFTLYKLDPKKCWDRLKVTVLEDLGTANIPLCRDFLWVASHKKWRDVQGGDIPVLACMIDEMCRSPKSRLANDFLAITNLHPICAGAAKEFYSFTNLQLADVYQDKKNDFFTRCIAGWYLGGRASRNPKNMRNRKGCTKTFLELHESGEYPAELLDTIKLSFSSGQSFARVLAIAWEHKQNGGTVSYIKEPGEKIHRIGRWYSEAWDIHTRVGGWAYTSIVKDDNVIGRFIRKNMPRGNHYRKLGMAAFAIEGMNLNPREFYTEMDSFTRLAVESYHDMTGNLLDDFLEVVRDNFYLIHEARSHAVNLIEGVIQ